MGAGAVQAEVATDRVRQIIGRHAATLLSVAASAIRHRLRAGRNLKLQAAGFAAELTEPGAAFVTLRRQADLRGCIGSSKAWRPLVMDVAENAASAAFEEPRFPALVAGELADLTVSVSVLTAPSELTASSEAELLASLRPGIGLILREGMQGALFLPQMWEQLPDARDFLSQLKRKAGWRSDHWSAALRVWRFEALSTEETNISEIGDLPPGD